MPSIKIFLLGVILVVPPLYILMQTLGLLEALAILWLIHVIRFNDYLFKHHGEKKWMKETGE